MPCTRAAFGAAHMPPKPRHYYISKFHVNDEGIAQPPLHCTVAHLIFRVFGPNHLRGVLAVLFEDGQTSLVLCALQVLQHREHVLTWRHPPEVLEPAVLIKLHWSRGGLSGEVCPVIFDIDPQTGRQVFLFRGLLDAKNFAKLTELGHGQTIQALTECKQGAAWVLHLAGEVGLHVAEVLLAQADADRRRAQALLAGWIEVALLLVGGVQISHHDFGITWEEREVDVRVYEVACIEELYVGAVDHELDEDKHVLGQLGAGYGGKF